MPGFPTPSFMAQSAIISSFLTTYWFLIFGAAQFHRLLMKASMFDFTEVQFDHVRFSVLPQLWNHPWNLKFLSINAKCVWSCVLADLLVCVYLTLDIKNWSDPLMFSLSNFFLKSIKILNFCNVCQVWAGMLHSDSASTVCRLPEELFLCKNNVLWMIYEH